jgi:hypothetical protein
VHAWIFERGEREYRDCISGMKRDCVLHIEISVEPQYAQCATGEEIVEISEFFPVIPRELVDCS